MLFAFIIRVARGSGTPEHLLDLLILLGIYSIHQNLILDKMLATKSLSYQKVRLIRSMENVISHTTTMVLIELI